MKNIAVWAITPNGADLAVKLAEFMPETDLFFSRSIAGTEVDATCFGRLSSILPKQFSRYRGHIFIMSTGIVVRMIAPLIRDKTEDPAVVVMDDAGRNAISLLSGHIGGANALARNVASIIGAAPVITTATDVNDVPAIDVLAGEKNLLIENPSAIKGVSMALLTGNSVCIHDPFGLLQTIPDAWQHFEDMTWDNRTSECGFPDDVPGIFVDDILPPWQDSSRILILRPRSLVVGMGCNRGTDMAEMQELLLETFEAAELSTGSIKVIATIDIKQDEPGLLRLAQEMGVPLVFFSRESLGSVETVENPSEMVEKHVGVPSVCEAAAILGAQYGRLIVPKRNTPNVTIAIARTALLS